MSLSNFQPSLGGPLSGLGLLAPGQPRSLLATPVYNGIEIDMFGLGNADSILVSSWSGSKVQRVLIDGGGKAHGETVLAKLAALGVTHLDHVVNTHGHDDHAAGLTTILKNPKLTIGKVWLHLPWRHIDTSVLHSSLTRSGAKKIAKAISESLETQNAIAQIIDARGLHYQEPFQGDQIGPLFVCGPTKQFYETMLRDFTDVAKLAKYESDIEKHQAKLSLESLYEQVGTVAGDGELGGEPTDPENESSVILYAKAGTDQLLFTGDAGVAALTAVSTAYDLKNLTWMQIPHHGSRRNLTQQLVEYFRPKTAWVSAEGTKKHPRRKVVNAFKGVGTAVYSTHHPSTLDLHRTFGVTPKRTGYGAATSL
jgi:beta-lactamase superfamily II metal-dependent hydrolase